MRGGEIVKKFLSSLAVFVITVICLIPIQSVHAQQYSYTANIPARQGWWYSTDDNGSGFIETSLNGPKYATLYVETSTLKSITFYAGRANSNVCNPTYTYATSGTVVTLAADHDPSTDVFKVYYPTSYPKGTLGAGIKIRNHSYTLSTTGTSYGVVNYN